MKKFFTVLILVFLLLCVMIYGLYSQFPNYDINALVTGNLILALIIGLSFSVVSRSLSDNNTQAVVRAKMKGTIIKFFTLIPIFLVYLYWNHETIHKPTLYILLGMYVVYLAVEVTFLSKLAKKKET